MGAPAAFEHRRQELAEMSAKRSAEVNDNEAGLVTFRQGGRVGRDLTVGHWMNLDVLPICYMIL